MAGIVEKTYAEAVFGLGKEQNCLETLCTEIFETAKILGENPDFIKLLSSPTISFDEKKEILNKVFSGKLSEYAMNFLFVITEKNRMSSFMGISECLKSLYNDYNGIIEVKVTTAEPLSDALKTKLKAKLESVSGKKITLVEKTDKSILGGIILDYDNVRMDSSIRNRLEGIKTSVKSIIA